MKTRQEMEKGKGKKKGKQAKTNGNEIFCDVFYGGYHYTATNTAPVQVVHMTLGAAHRAVVSFE